MTFQRFIIFFVSLLGLLLCIFIITAVDRSEFLIAEQEIIGKEMVKSVKQDTDPLVDVVQTVSDPETHTQRTQAGVLRVLCWEEYFEMDEDAEGPAASRAPLLREFMQREGCRIEYQEYGDRWEMIERVQSFVNYYDCIMIPAELVPMFMGLQRIETLDQRKMYNLRHIDKQILDKSGNEWVQKRFAPYAYGTTGLLYRRSAFGNKAPRLKDLFQPHLALQGRIGLLDEPYITYLFGFLHLGIRPELADVADVSDCTDLLRPLFESQVYSIVSSDTDDLWDGLTNNTIDVCPMWAGDAVDFIEQQENDDYDFVVPNEGGEFWIDGWIILSDAPNADLAAKFINYLFEPSVHARFAGYIYYAAPSKAAREELGKEDMEQILNRDIYPSADLIESLSQVNTWLDQTQKDFNNLKKLLKE